MGVTTLAGLAKKLTAAGETLSGTSRAATIVAAQAATKTVEATLAAKGGLQMAGVTKPLHAGWKIVSASGESFSVSVRPDPGETARWNWIEEGTKAHGPKKKQVLVLPGNVFTKHVKGRKPKHVWEVAAPVIIAQTGPVYEKAVAARLASLF